MSAATHQGQTPYYFVPGPSRHPVMAAIGLFFVILGAGQWINGHGWGAYSLLFGLLWWAVVLFQWFSQAIREIRAEEETHRIPAIRQFRPACVEPCCAPVDDTTDTAAMPKNVARVEVTVSEDVL